MDVGTNPSSHLTQWQNTADNLLGSVMQLLLHLYNQEEKIADAEELWYRSYRYKGCKESTAESELREISALEVLLPSSSPRHLKASKYPKHNRKPPFLRCTCETSEHVMQNKEP